MVPKLKEIHVIRDSWTKLNVIPAKIMQVCGYTRDCLLIPFFNIARTCSVRAVFDEHPQAEDAKCTSKTLQYIEACNKIFERGFLSHEI